MTKNSEIVTTDQFGRPLKKGQKIIYFTSLYNGGIKKGYGEVIKVNDETQRVTVKWATAFDYTASQSNILGKNVVILSTKDIPYEIEK